MSVLLSGLYVCVFWRPRTFTFTKPSPNQKLFCILDKYIKQLLKVYILYIQWTFLWCMKHPFSFYLQPSGIYYHKIAADLHIISGFGDAFWMDHIKEYTSTLLLGKKLETCASWLCHVCLFTWKKSRLDFY
jgi:hypothetical protein